MSLFDLLHPVTLYKKYTITTKTCFVCPYSQPYNVAHHTNPTTAQHCTDSCLVWETMAASQLPGKQCVTLYRGDALLTAHCKLNTTHCTLQTEHCSLDTGHCTGHCSKHYTLNTTHCTQHTAHCTIHCIAESHYKLHFKYSEAANNQTIINYIKYSFNTITHYFTMNTKHYTLHSTVFDIWWCGGFSGKKTNRIQVTPQQHLI